MSNESANKTNGKILFGCDFLYLMRFMELPSTNEKADAYDHITDAAMRLFLLQWDFTVVELDAANRLFWEKLEAKTLDDDINTVLDRIIKFINNDKTAQEKLIIELSAIADFNQDLSEKEVGLIKYLQGKFDFRPSEVDELYRKGLDWSAALNYLGSAFIKSGIQPKNE